MKVYVRFIQPPVSAYWSMAMSNGGAYIACQLHWEKPSDSKEFDSMDEFYKFCKTENVEIPWLDSTKP